MSNDNEFGTSRSSNNAFSVARSELNTLRLTTENNTRFVVTNKNTGKILLNINLTEYLLLTRELAAGSNTLSDQEYLDNQCNYSIVFFMTPTGNTREPYVCLTMNINGWIIGLNNSEI